MANVLISNMPYVGALAISNIFDTIQSETEKHSFVLNVLKNENIDISDITQVVSVQLFANAVTHKNRVISDGGAIGDYSKLIKALNFVRLNALSEYAALSIAFGYKLNTANSVTKLYSLSGASFDAVVDTPTRCQKIGLSIKTTSTSATTITVQNPFRPQNALFGISGEFENISEAGGITLSTQNTSATSGITPYESIAISAPNGGSTAIYRGVGDANVTRPLEQSRNYNKKGVSLLLSDAVHAYSDAYTKDLLYSYTTEKLNMSNNDCYVSIRLSSSANAGLNTKLREAWFIANGTTAMAKSISQYLNY